MAAEYQVRINVYDTSKGKSAVIAFANGAEELLGGDCIRWEVVNDRCYLFPDDGGLTISKLRHSIQIGRGANYLTPFRGEYGDLQWDSVKNAYYISEAHKDPLTTVLGPNTGKRPNYTPHSGKQAHHIVQNDVVTEDKAVEDIQKILNTETTTEEKLVAVKVLLEKFIKCVNEDKMTEAQVLASIIVSLV